MSPVSEPVSAGNFLLSTENRQKSEAWKCSTFIFIAAMASNVDCTNGTGKNRRPVSIISPRWAYAGPSMTDSDAACSMPSPTACSSVSIAYAAPKTPSAVAVASPEAVTCSV